MICHHFPLLCCHVCFFPHNVHLFDELFLNAVLLVGLEKGKQGLFFAHRTTTQHHRQTLEQGGLPVERLVLLVLCGGTFLSTCKDNQTEAENTHIINSLGYKTTNNELTGSLIPSCALR